MIQDMTDAFDSNGAAVTTATPQSPAAQVVVDFMDALRNADDAKIARLIAENIEYENVSLPTIRGRKRVSAAFKTFARYGAFDVVIHRIAADGSTVLTERTDAVTVGPLRMQFWVCGTFEVVDGEITLWRDYFDWASMFRATARGILGIAVPKLRPSF